MHAIRYLKPAHSFRADYDYDNVLYVVAGQLVEAVSGQRWEASCSSTSSTRWKWHDTQTSIDARVPDQAACTPGRRSVARRWSAVRSDPGDDWRRFRAGRRPAGQRGRHGPLAAGAARPRRARRQTAVQRCCVAGVVDAAYADSDRRQPPPLALAQPHFQAYALGFEVSDYRGYRDHHPPRWRAGWNLGGGDHSGEACRFAIMLNSEDVGTLLAMREHLLDTCLACPHRTGSPATSRCWISARRGPAVLGGCQARTRRDRAVAAALTLQRRLPRFMVWHRNDSPGESWPDDQPRSFAGHARLTRTRAVRHLSHALGSG